MTKRDFAELRADFPLLSRSVNGQTLAYLDNAATSQKPQVVIDSIRRYYEYYNANVHRALHSLGEEATAAYEGARAKVAAFIGASSPSEVVFTRGTTESINLAASSWGDANLGEGDVILLSTMEHHSNLVPWQLLSARRGARLAFIPFEADGSLDLDRVEENWDQRVKIVSITHMSNVLGTINDVARLAEIAHAHGALLFVDGAQSIPHMKIDVAALGCDFFAFSSHKVYGPMGIGVLWARESILESMPPWMGGGDMIRAVRLEASTWNDLPWKFEAGTPNVEGAIGLGTALDYVDHLGHEAIVVREAELSSHALERLGGVEGLVLHGGAKSRGAVFSFSIGTIHPHDIAQYLDREGIAVRAGHHCAQPLMRILGVPATTRASLSFYNSEEEIDRLASALEGARRFYS